VTRLGRSRAPPTTVELVLAPERKTDHDGRLGPLHLPLADLCRVCALQSLAGEGEVCDAVPARSYADAVATYAANMCNSEMTAAIRRLQTAGMTDEERHLKKFTRRNLPEWDECFDAQLYAQSCIRRHAPVCTSTFCYRGRRATKYPTYPLEQCCETRRREEVLLLSRRIQACCPLASPICSNICVLH
jgi:hypothetical protein